MSELQHWGQNAQLCLTKTLSPKLIDNWTLHHFQGSYLKIETMETFSTSLHSIFTLGKFCLYDL